jgi:hypothetical protein
MPFNPNDTSYERKELTNYFHDSGIDYDEAVAKVAKMSDKQVLAVIDTIPEEGEDE